MTRMRKERPTMRMSPVSAVDLYGRGIIDEKTAIEHGMPSLPPGLTSFAIGLDPTTPEAFELWKSQTVPNAEGTRAINPSMPPMPPIRCTMPVPCGHCWYCAQHKAQVAK